MKSTYQQPALTPAFSFRRLVLLRLLTENIVGFLLQYTGLMLSVSSGQFLPLNFASGTAAAFIFMRGFTVLPGMWLGMCCVSSVYASVYLLQAILLYWLTQRFISPGLLFYRPLSVLKFIVLSILLTAITSLIVPGWLENLNGLLVMACAITTWDLYFPETEKLWQVKKLPLILPFSLLALTAITQAYCTTPSLALLLSWVAFMLTLFIAIRFAWCGAVAALFLLGLISNLAVYLGAPFSYPPYMLTATIISGLLMGITSPHVSFHFLSKISYVCE